MSGSESVQEWKAEESFPSVCGQGRELIESILGRMTKWGWSDRDIFAVNMALEESFTNAIEHGNHCNAQKKFHVRCRMDDRKISVSVRDEGRGFRRDAVPDPLSAENLENPSGRGVLLIHGFMSKVWFNDSGNEINMEKYRAEFT